MYHIYPPMLCGSKVTDFIFKTTLYRIHNKWVPVTTAWCVLRLWMEEQLLICRVAAKIPNKQLRTADKGWSSSLGVGRGANNPSLKTYPVTQHSYSKPRPRTDTLV